MLAGHLVVGRRFEGVGLVVASRGDGAVLALVVEEDREGQARGFARKRSRLDETPGLDLDAPRTARPTPFDSFGATRLVAAAGGAHWTAPSVLSPSKSLSDLRRDWSALFRKRKA